ncbi:MAG TPA: PadR family transcriptional regulator [Solirubrobacterales bacterium]|nr:PadR family transcriptional regulator [Solirubrobacterales bacterium]
MHHRCNPRHAGVHGRQEFARSRGLRYGRGRGGPRARRGDVRAAALALLAERPMHGYEMIKEIEERTEGAWTPSAGSIYPTLQMLEEEGLISGQEIDGKRRFTLTDSGKSEQESRASEETPWDAVRAGADPEQIHLRDSVHKLHHAIGQVFHAADEAQQRRVRELLDETRRKIYAILAEEG